MVDIIKRKIGSDTPRPLLLEASKGGTKVSRMKDPLYKDSYLRLPHLPSSYRCRPVCGRFLWRSGSAWVVLVSVRLLHVIAVSNCRYSPSRALFSSGTAPTPITRPERPQPTPSEPTSTTPRYLPRWGLHPRPIKGPVKHPPFPAVGIRANKKHSAGPSPSRASCHSARVARQTDQVQYPALPREGCGRLRWC